MTKQTIMVKDAFGREIRVYVVKAALASPMSRKSRKQFERDCSLIKLNCVVPSGRESLVRRRIVSVTALSAGL